MNVLLLVTALTSDDDVQDPGADSPDHNELRPCGADAVHAIYQDR